MLFAKRSSSRGDTPFSSTAGALDAFAPFSGFSALSFVFYAYNPDMYASPLFQVFSGGTMLCAFFIATDPVSASTTPRGRLIYGFGIGMLAWIIRSWGGYPDGIAFAVLLMNMAAPTIDHYTRPRVYGHRAGDDD